MENGKVSDPGATLKIERVSSIPALIQASMTQQFNLIPDGALAIPRLRESGVMVEVVATMMRFNPEGNAIDLWVTADSPIQTVEDLKGKTVAVVSAELPAIVYLRWAMAERHGMNADTVGGDVNWVEMPPAQFETALETGGGIFRALPLLGPDPFLVVNGDIWTDFDFARLPSLDTEALAALVMVPNPPHHPRGDFALLPRDGGGHELRVDVPADAARHTYSGIGVYRPEFFAGCVPGRFPMLPLFRSAAAARRLRGVLYQGSWSDIGTPERLRELDERLAGGAVG